MLKGTVQGESNTRKMTQRGQFKVLFLEIHRNSGREWSNWMSGFSLLHELAFQLLVQFTYGLVPAV